MNYEEMSDFEINKAVERITGMYCEDCEGAYMPTMDYCNNPYDAWPIIMENRITLTPYDNEKEGWFATTDTSFFVDHMNPLRAAMIIFLMMNEGD